MQYWSGRWDVPMLPAPVSHLLLFLKNSRTGMVLFQERWGFFCFGLGFFISFFVEVAVVEMKRESHMKGFRI